jgi:hypothetical protein
MHTCYSLCTNEVLNFGLSNLKHLTMFLLSLALKIFLQLNRWSRSCLEGIWVVFIDPHVKSNHYSSKQLLSGTEHVQCIQTEWLRLMLASVRWVPTGRVRWPKPRFGTSMFCNWHSSLGVGVTYCAASRASYPTGTAMRPVLRYRRVRSTLQSCCTCEQYTRHSPCVRCLQVQRPVQLK